MAVACPACGKWSQDEEFCDFCNADLGRPREMLAPPRCPITAAGVELPMDHRALLGQGDQTVFVQADGKSWRVHWLSPLDYLRRRPALKRRQRLDLPPLPRFRWVEEAGGAWVLAESAGRWQPPWLAQTDNPLENLAGLVGFAGELAKALDSLHGAGLVWLNFDPAFLETSAHGGLSFTNLDLGVFPAGQIPEDFRVHPGFAAPEIVQIQADEIGPRTDVFHVAIFCYYWLAGMLPVGFRGQGLDAFDYDIPPLRLFVPHVLPGVQSVIARGLALDPRERFESPAELVEALRQALDQAQQRWAYAGAVTWEVGAHTRTGRAKADLDRGNEDQVLVKPFTGPDRMLALVADGISTCDVGSGALASLIATILLENEFGPETREADFLAHIQPVCRHAAQTLLDWALEKGYGDQLAQGVDLMGTTLTIGWLEGRHLTLANLGDSRAYLVDNRGAEQLTVDGDLGSGMLAEGTPPEEIKMMGPVARALRQCIGGCMVDAEGRVAILEDSCRPALTRWPLLPGDVLVLCTDGLVEEGLFLEPDQVFDLVRQNSHLSAAELAVLLADAADSLQRLPSLSEPEGFGDNISVVVIRVNK